MHIRLLQQFRFRTTSCEFDPILLDTRMKIALVNQYATYEDSLPIAVLKWLCGSTLEITTPNKAELIIVGSFRPRRRGVKKLAYLAGKPLIRENRSALRLFHVYENIRHDAVPSDYTISSDLGVNADNHFRLPFWMESLDWAKHGVENKKSKRVRRLLEIEELMVPNGRRLLERPRKAALFCAHLKEPRRTLFDALSKIMPTEGFGPAFALDVAHHDASNFFKDDVLQGFAVNLCPENSLYPGYCTEKIIEAYGSGCLPVTWTDPNVRVDFNPKAFVNTLDFAAEGYEYGLREALAPQRIAEYAAEPLFRGSAEH